MRIHQLSFTGSKTYPQFLSLSLGFKGISVEDTLFPGRKKGDFVNCCPPPPTYLQIVISSWWKTFKSFFREEDANCKAARVWGGGRMALMDEIVWVSQHSVWGKSQIHGKRTQKSHSDKGTALVIFKWVQRKILPQTALTKKDLYPGR